MIVIFKRDTVEQPQVVQPTELFKMTKTQPGLYYKLAKEFTPELATSSIPAAAAITASGETVTAGTDSTSTAVTTV